MDLARPSATAAFICRGSGYRNDDSHRNEKHRLRGKARPRIVRDPEELQDCATVIRWRLCETFSAAPLPMCTDVYPLVAAPPISQPEPAHAHVVQFYEADEQQLTVNVARYLIDGLDRGDGMPLIATERHRDQFICELIRRGRIVEVAIRDGQLVILDSQTTLDKFLVGGEPDAARFHAVIGDAIRHVRASSGGLRAYGDMVGLLWSAGRHQAAIRLEELWDALVQAVGFELFC